jgi:5-methyltetrahydrofolate--homocysteine methyltransferase
VSAHGGPPADFSGRLRRGPCLLLDGGLGSELIARGLPQGTPPERWTLERPAELAAVHRAYVEAGSEAVHANTFGANGARLERFGLGARMEELNLAAVALARASGAAFVIADVGPTGEYLPPVGTADPGHWRNHFLAQARVLAGSGVDAFHIETMTDVREALVALECLREAAPGVPVMVSLTFERRRRGFFTIMGDPLGASLARLALAGAVAVGANCGLASGDMRELARELLSLPPAPGTESVPFVIQPNAGRPELAAAGVRYAQDPLEFASDLASLLPAPRLAALGGCCGTDPRFVAALRARMDEWAAGTAATAIPGGGGAPEATS